VRKRKRSEVADVSRSNAQEEPRAITWRHSKGIHA